MAAQQNYAKEYYKIDEAAPRSLELATPRNTLFPPPRPRSFRVAKGAMMRRPKLAYILALALVWHAYARVQFGAVRIGLWG